MNKINKEDAVHMIDMLKKKSELLSQNREV